MAATRLGRIGLMLAPLLASSLVASALTGPTAASASRRTSQVPTSITVVSGYHRFRLDGQKWRLSVSAQSGSAGSLTVTLSRLVTGGIETHVWQIPRIPKRGITSSSSGDVTIHPTRSATSPLLRMDLAFTPTRSTSAVCSSGSETDYVGHMTGLLRVHTRLKGLGTVGGTDISLGHTKVTIDAGCVTEKHECSEAGIAWKAQSTNFAFGFSNQSGDSFAILRTVSLKAPSGATRMDGAASLEPQLVLKKHRILRITTAKNTPISGTARLVATSGPFVRYGTCYVNGVAKTSVSTTWAFATFSGSTLDATTAFGTVKSGESGNGTISEYAVK